MKLSKKALDELVRLDAECARLEKELIGIVLRQKRISQRLENMLGYLQAQGIPEPD